MIIHTYVISIGGTLFSFCISINHLSQFSFGPHSCCFVRGPSALDKFKFNFFRVPSMIIHTYVMSIVGTLFRFICKLTV